MEDRGSRRGPGPRPPVLLRDDPRTVRFSRPFGKNRRSLQLGAGPGACWGSRIVARGAGPQRPSAGGAGQAAARGLGRLPAEHLLGPRVRTLSLNGHGHPRLRPPPAAPMIRPAGRLALRQAAGHRAGLTPGVLRVDLHRTRPRCDGLLSALAPVPSGLEASSVQGRLRGQRLRFSFTLKTENSTCKRET